jgi:hypothetical protein
MLKPMRRIRRVRPVLPPPSAFTGFRFPREVIVLAVRWYLRYGLSYRDVEELLAERGITVDHVTVYRWVQRFTPLLIDAARPCRHAPGDRWFVDETYVKVAGCSRGWHGATWPWPRTEQQRETEHRNPAEQRTRVRPARRAVLVWLTSPTGRSTPHDHPCGARSTLWYGCHGARSTCNTPQTRGDGSDVQEHDSQSLGR